MIVSTLDRVYGRPKWPPGSWLPPGQCSIMRCGHTLNMDCYLLNDARVSLTETRLEPGGSL